MKHLKAHPLKLSLCMVALGIPVFSTGLQGQTQPAPAAAAAATDAPKPARPPWDPGRTIKKSSWNYDGPVKTIFTAENAPPTPKLEDLALKDSIEQYGITWTFEKPARVGQFITGDWYVVGEVKVIKISPEPLFGDAVKKSPDWKIINKQAVTEDKFEGKWARNGSVLNQRVVGTSYSGFDSRLGHRHYDPEQFAHLPIAMKPGDSLISSISATDPLTAYSGHGQPLLTAAVLTCIATPQPADAFRPSYADRESKIYLARNLHRELLYNLPKPAAAPANLSEFARLFQRPWLDTVSWGYANPELNTPRYGQRMTESISMASLMLHTDYPAVEKEQLLVHYVQYGVDLWGIVRAGSKGWQGHGGFNGGRKWTLIFSGIMLGDEAMRSPNTAYPKVLFGEDTQTAVGKSWTGHDVVFTSHPAWTDPKTKSPELEPPEKWAEIRAKDKGRRGDQSEGYRRCCTSIVWPGQALAARLMRAEKYWNHDPFFAYMDRWMDTEDIHATAKRVLEAAKAEAAKADATDASKGYAEGSWTLKQPRTNPFMLEMWTKHRKNLPAPLEAK
jgi:hypothetical protein